MNNTIVCNSDNPEDFNESGAWLTVDPMTALHIKREEVATSLISLLLYTGKSQSWLAERAGWSKSRVSNVLSGDQNLTLKTIVEFTQSLGYDFDVVFRAIGECPIMQSWQKPSTAQPLPSSAPPHLYWHNVINETTQPVISRNIPNWENKKPIGFIPIDIES